MAVEIVTVKRPHAWLAKRDDKPADHTCRNCGKRRGAVVSAVCFEEEIEVTSPDA